MALQVTAMQATWAALVAYWNRLECGRGDHIDFSLYEATAQAIDPAMGTVGTAQVAGYAETRDRPAPGPYPIFRCRDGHVRVVLLAPRQWHAMRRMARRARGSAGSRARDDSRPGACRPTGSTRPSSSISASATSTS